MKTKVLHHSQSKCNFVSNPVQQKETTDTNKFTSNKKPKNTSGILEFDCPIYILGRSSIVGKKEKDGPLGKFFDKVVKDDKNGQKNFEKAEIKLMTTAVKDAIADANLKIDKIGTMLAGDLLNQLNVANYAARDLQLPFLGLYSACSTMTESMLLGSTLICTSQIDNIVCAVSSHFASAERQFRYPLEYGAQKPPYAQWTVTGAASMVLGTQGKGVRITKGLIGRVIDMGTNDISNMGAAMAPAFVDTLLRFFSKSNTSIADYDLVVSGDLGKLGSDIAIKLAGEKGVILNKNYIDCGSIMYSHEQNAYQGGSGPACSAVVINSYIIKKMLANEYKKVLYLATGALMSPQSCFQGETIPCISHAVLLEN